MQKYVIFKMYNESGHLYPAFHLAKQLQANGEYIAVFVAEQKFKALIEEQGFKFEAEMQYDNISAHQSYKNTSTNSSGVSRPSNLWRSRQFITLEFLKFTAGLVAMYQPVLLFIDELHFNYLVAMHDLGVPITTLSTYALSLESPYVPPPNCALIPRASRAFRVKNFFLWQRVYLTRFIQQSMLQLRNPGADFYYKLLCKEKGYDLSRRECKKFYWIDDASLDKLVLVPEFFDFKHPTRKNIYYIGDCVDLSRVERPLKLEFTDSRPLIYSSLGTQTQRDIHQATHIYRKILAAFKHKPRYRVIVSAPEAISAQLTMTDLPEHISVINNAPQISVLKQSSLAIIHGGMGSIKECLRLAVPMLILPLNKDVDQLGNAARVCSGGYGLRMDSDALDEFQLNKTIDHMLESPCYSENVKQAQKTIKSHEEERPFLLYVKNRLSEKLNQNR